MYDAIGTVVFGYVRVSGDSQVEKDGPVRQQEAAKSFCVSNHLPEPKFHHSDLGVSGTIEGLNRPGLFGLLSEAAEISSQGRPVVIVVEKLERLARDLIVSEFIFRELRDRKIMVYATDQGLVDQAMVDGDPSRKLIRQIFGALAEYEKSSLVIKLRVARERKKRETGKCEGRRAYGVGDEANGKSERIILNMIRQLRSTTPPSTWETIAQQFTQSGVRKTSGKTTKWRCGEVWQIWHRHLARIGEPKRPKGWKQYEYNPDKPEWLPT